MTHSNKTSLRYITATAVPSNGAQSIQITRMAEAFAQITDFTLCLPAVEKGESFAQKQGLQVHRIGQAAWPRWLRTMALILMGLKDIPPKGIIYTRDIAIAAVAAVRGVNVAYEAHNPFRTWLGDLIFRLVQRKLVIVAISSGVQDTIARTYGIPGDHIIIAHDGVSESLCHYRPDRATLRSRLGISPTTYVALYTGTLASHKGAHLVVDVAPMLPDISFYLVGGTNAENSEFSATRSIPSNVFLVERQSQELVLYWQHAADILLLPNTTENDAYRFTSPLKLFEYLASGIPTIASGVGAINEVVDSSVATVFDPSAISSFADAIKKVRDEPKAAEQRAQEGVRRVLNNYTWERRARYICDKLQGAIAQRR